MTQTQTSASTTSPSAGLSGPAAWALLGGIALSVAFTVLIAWGDQFLRVELPPDEGPRWYYWQLAQPTFWTRATAWGFYALHQVVWWTLIYRAQTGRLRYESRLHPINVLTLAANAGFVLLHFIQTQVWYDGLAQDVPSWSSQNSVILMLVWILLMENSRRGLVFGWKAPIAASAMQWARKYHGYVFAWALAYTFWFHPMVNTPGHLLGFLYMFLLILQGSLFFTRVHLNRWWTVTLEVLVLAHGALVAYLQHGTIWPMFAFGFGGLFVITQMHGLGLKTWMKWALLALYCGLMLIVYQQIGWQRLPMVLAVPAIEYVSVAALALCLGGGLWLARRLSPTP